MRVFSLSEALVFLNVLMPGTAPKSEITLRRAIQKNELKADVGIGRAGTRIREEDLLEYSKRFERPASKGSYAGHQDFLVNALISDTQIKNPPSLLDIAKAFGARADSDSHEYKVALLEARALWEKRCQALQSGLDSLSGEVSRSRGQIDLFDDEIKKT